MAKALVNSLAAEWDPRSTRTSTARTDADHQGKMKGKRSGSKRPPSAAGRRVDLMERLRQSLDQATSRPARGSKARAKKPTRESDAGRVVVGHWSLSIVISLSSFASRASWPTTDDERLMTND